MAVRIGIRELRARLASVLESSTPIEITRHGETIGFYVPLPRQAGPQQRAQLLEAGRAMQAELLRQGLSEKELLADFGAWRRQQAPAARE